MSESQGIQSGKESQTPAWRGLQEQSEGIERAQKAPISLSRFHPWSDFTHLRRCHTLECKLARLKQHCETVGRDYHSIRRTADTLCAIGETEEQARAKMLARQLDRPLLAGVLISTLDTIRQLLSELEAGGIQEMWLSFPDCLGLEPLRVFAKGFLV